MVCRVSTLLIGVWLELDDSSKLNLLAVALTLRDVDACATAITLLLFSAGCCKVCDIAISERSTYSEKLIRSNVTRARFLPIKTSRLCFEDTGLA